MAVAAVAEEIRWQQRRLDIQSSHWLVTEHVDGKASVLLFEGAEDLGSWSSVECLSALADNLALAGFSVRRVRCRDFPSRLDLHQFLTSVIPEVFDRVSAGEPPVVITSGLYSPVLLAALGRGALEPTRIRGLVHINPVRLFPSPDWPYSLTAFITRLRLTLSLAYRRWCRTFSVLAKEAGAGASLRQGLRQWCKQPQWTDPWDGFNFRVAVRAINLPVSLYVYTGGLGWQLRKAAIQEVLEDLGRHNVHIRGGRRSGSRGLNRADTNAGHEKVAGHHEKDLILLWIEEVVERCRQVL